MARIKASDGVVATIERLTGRMPCPTFLRDTLNKYLYKEELFEGAKSGVHGCAKKLGKLQAPDTDNLVRNLLELDELFSGETSTVVGIISSSVDSKKLNEKLDVVQRTMQQRLDIYRYWLDRIASAREILTNPLVDLKAVRLDENLTVSARAASEKLPPFALHALRVHESNESKGRTGQPSAAEYVERAEAYLALDDLESADKNARLALEQDQAVSRGWFIRVAVALRRQHSALWTAERMQIVAQEEAEPMSGHERWAMERADEETGIAFIHQQLLDEILPQAILHWPASAGHHEHPELWRQVRNAFVARMFSIAVHDVVRAGSSQQLAHQNGLAPEWAHEREKHVYRASVGSSASPVFTAIERQAIMAILTEYDTKQHLFVDVVKDSRIGNGFKLFHLRYVLSLEKCDIHWARLQELVSGSPVRLIATELMRDATVARLWQAHYCRYAGVHALEQFHRQWLQRSEAESCGQLRHTALRQSAYLYHHQFVRQQFDMCSEVAKHAIALFDSAAALDGWFAHEVHPCDDSVGMPIHLTRYWEYLAALAAVKQRCHGGPSSPEAEIILRDEARWRTLFSEESTHLWTVSEEFEEGGGEDWQEPPYGLDLRHTGGWNGEVEHLTSFEPQVFSLQDPEHIGTPP